MFVFLVLILSVKLKRCVCLQQCISERSCFKRLSDVGGSGCRRQRERIQHGCRGNNPDSVADGTDQVRQIQHRPGKTDSTNQLLLDCPRFSTEFGKRSFSYLAPTVWNVLLLDTRLSPTADTFKRRGAIMLCKCSLKILLTSLYLVKVGLTNYSPSVLDTVGCVI